jgi:hypothetical protein
MMILPQVIEQQAASAPEHASDVTPEPSSHQRPLDRGLANANPKASLSAKAEDADRRICFCEEW